MVAVAQPVLRAFLALLLLAGCTAEDERAPVQPTPEPGPLCVHNAGGLEPDPTAYRLVLDAVALPAWTLQTAASGVPGELFAKQGLLVRADTQVRLTLAPEAPAGTRIGWGSPGPEGSSVTVPACPHNSGWLAFPGGYTVRAASCVPLIVRVGDRAERAEVSVGTAC